MLGVLAEISPAFIAVFALAGVAVRLQLSLFKAFDFSVAVGVLVGAEVGASVSNWVDLGITSETIMAVTAAAAVSGLVIGGWNRVVDRSFRGRRDLSAPVLVASLGLSTAAIGMTTLVRGPGIRRASLPHAVLPASYPPVLALMLIFGALIVLSLWQRSKLGFSFRLWADNDEFAREVGVERATVAFGTGALGGAFAGASGVFFALTGGVAPHSGLQIFLYGAASALLLNYPSALAALGGGVLLGASYGAVQLVVSPALANLILFSFVVALLLLRGSTREEQGNR